MKNHWVEVELGKVATINPRIKKDEFDSDLEVQFLPMKLVEEEINHISLEETRKFHEVSKGSYTPFENGDIIFAKVTPCMENGKVAVVDNLKNGIGFGSSEFHVVRSRVINRNYIFYYLVSKRYRGAAERAMTGAVGLRRVPKKFLEDTIIPIPPLPEQRAIVAKIEQLFSELDSGISSLRKAQDQLKVYRQAVLKKAFKGDWDKSLLKELAEITGGVTKGKKYKDKILLPYPYLRVANVQDGFLDLSIIKEISITKEEFDKYELQFEDVLFTEGGDKDKLGRGTVWKNEISNCIHQNHIFRARVNREKLNPYFLTYYAASPLGKDYFFKNGKQTTNLASINKTILSSLPIPKIDLEGQLAIIKEIERSLSVCDKLESDIQKNLDKAEALRQSILKKAFEGELLTEEELAACKLEPDWEPVEKLLEKIEN